MVGFNDIIAIGMLIGLILIALIPLKPQRILYGIIIFFFGVLPLLKMFGIINLDVYSSSLFKFATIFIVMIVGQLLFTEAVREDNFLLKIVSMFIGIVIILVTMVPWMGEYNAVSFSIPSYAPIIDFGIYVFAGVLTIIGAFKAQIY